jgi:hypothetical protein
VEHHRDAVGLGGAVNDLQFFHAAQVVVGIKQLMRRMDLNQPDPEPHQVLDIGHDVRGVPWMQRPARDQPPPIFLHVIGDELVHAGRESDHLRRHVVDEHRAIDPRLVQVMKEGARRPAELLDLRELRPLGLHQAQRLRLEHLQRLNVDVAVGDQNRLQAAGFRLQAPRASFQPYALVANC